MVLRRSAATVLAVVGALLLPLALIATWSGTVSDTDRYVSAIAPLAERRDVQDAVAERVAEVAAAQVEVSGSAATLEQYLRSQGLDAGGAARSAVRSAVRAAALVVVRSDAFPGLWTSAHRTFHEELVRALASDRGTDVRLDLRPVLERALSRIAADGPDLTLAADAVPADASITLASDSDLDAARTAYRALDEARTWLPPLVGVILVLALLLAVDRPRMLRRIGVLSAVTVALTLPLLALATAGIDDSGDTASGRTLASALWGALSSRLWHLLLAGLVASVVVALVGLVAGRARRA